MCLPSERSFNCRDETHECNRPVISDVEHPAWSLALAYLECLGRGWRTSWRSIDKAHDPINHIVDVCEVTLHLSMIVQINALPSGNSSCKSEVSHVWAAPRSVNCKESQPSRRNTEQL